MRPREASAFLGHLNPLLSTSYTSVGRAATQPLLDHASNRREGNGPCWANKHWWTHSMTHILSFLEQLFVHQTPLVFDFRSHQRPKVVIYTVASFSEHRNRMVFYFSTKRPKVNLSAMQPVLTGSCWCGMTPPLIHGSHWMEQRGDSAQDAHQSARTSGNCCSNLDSWERVFAKPRGCFLL